MSLQDTEILADIKEAVHQIDPDAEVYLYGSRARGDALDDSDWDVLVVLSNGQKAPKEDAIRSRLFDIALNAGQVISSFVYTQEEWNLPMRRETAFHQNVLREGVRL
ncbi:MAG: nucleotidyltransferase domain-containing protein [Candidatus Hydrogenedentes bacterium]|nr:nucleotidyltransferase domain-containing protein [Candidatus Hydrogenedentota bacterium]